MSATLTDLQKKQLEQAEELLFEGPEKEGFVKDLYFGQFKADAIMPFPELPESAVAEGDEMVARAKRLCDDTIDAVAISFSKSSNLLIIELLGVNFTNSDKMFVSNKYFNIINLFLFQLIDLEFLQNPYH